METTLGIQNGEDTCLGLSCRYFFDSFGRIVFSLDGFIKVAGVNADP